MNPVREIAYRLDPVLWMREVLDIVPHRWQEEFLRSPQGASVVVLTARQVGKTTAASERAFCNVVDGMEPLKGCNCSRGYYSVYSRRLSIG